MVQQLVTFLALFSLPRQGPKCNMLHGFERESCNICNIWAFIALPWQNTNISVVAPTVGIAAPVI
jgi:hypothetical protein